MQPSDMTLEQQNKVYVSELESLRFRVIALEKERQRLLSLLPKVEPKVLWEKQFLKLVRVEKEGRKYLRFDVDDDRVSDSIPLTPKDLRSMGTSIADAIKDGFVDLEEGGT
jgi:hypothetical protein